MTDFLDAKRGEIDVRLKELRPLVDEYHRLEQAASALASVGGRAADSAASRRRPTGSRSGGGRRGRPRGSGTRSIQALKLVRARPGVSLRELADAMNIKANYLYRVMPTLEAEGKVVKRDGGWHPG